jgi:hypothetical protein
MDEVQAARFAQEADYRSGMGLAEHTGYSIVDFVVIGINHVGIVQW